MRISSFAIATVICLAVPLGSLQAADTGTIRISQSNPPSEVLGSWILILPDNTQKRMTRPDYTLTEMPSGQYTVKFDPPQGATTVLSILLNAEDQPGIDTPQYSFFLKPGNTWDIHATYTFTLTGTVSVTTDPPGVPFVVSGPNNWEVEGVTPASYPQVPEGLYSAKFTVPKGCSTPSTLSDRLVKNSRIGLHVKLSCDSLPSTQEATKSMTHVSGFVDGKALTFTDVAMNEWYAPFIFNAVKTNMMSGYNSANGEANGLFGPGDTVSLAQLAKVAHRLAGIDETSFRGTPMNTAANGQWFSSFYLSAERLSWVVFRNPRENPNRPATRAEVIATLLQALDVERVWPKGDLFRDVTPTTPYADVIETAALDGLVSIDANGTFAPERAINRAELAKLLMTAVELYKEDTATVQPDALDR